MISNDLSPVLPLDGEWQFRLAENPEFVIRVPTAWEAHVRDKRTDGPAVYRRAFELPENWLNTRVFLEADAISFDATVRINGQPAAHHQGMWSPFQCDLTTFLRAGENLLEIEVWKPGGRFPLRETLAGFLPDVATTFGGIWQGIRLRRLSKAALHDLKVLTRANAEVHVRGSVVGWDEAGRVEVRAEILDSSGRSMDRLATRLHRGETEFDLRLGSPGMPRWKPGRGGLCSLVLTVELNGEPVARAVRQIGFREIRADGCKLLLDGAPLHVRGALDWGWWPDRICPSPSREEVLADFARARALGFNLMKLCLFVPDETTFDVADETGMMLWLEMPMWLPRVTPAFRELALREYRDVFRRLHHHPSIVLLSLGCELDAEAGADFLLALNQLAREWFPNALLCDNSGSAEAYGGIATSISDFYDYHFYTDPHFFAPLVHHFDRPYRPAKPWIYGEFCDADTLRDFGLLQPEPWWLTDPTPLDRDDFIAMREYRSRLSAAGVTDGGAELTHIARCQATAVRKFILEQVRSKDATGGYVVTGWRDTPIATAGMLDDRRELKFDPAEWQRFNADRVLTIDRERRRQWLGGDRPAHKDPFVWWQGENAEVHLVLSDGGGPLEGAQMNWRLATADGLRVAGGSKEAIAVRGGEVEEVAVLRFPMPASSDGRPVELELSAELLLGAERREVEGQNSKPIKNDWRLWALPRPSLPHPVTLAEPFSHTNPFVRLDPQARNWTRFDAARDEPKDAILIATVLSDEILAHVAKGGRPLVWQLWPDGRYTRSVPFWREAIHIFQPHRFWDEVPHADYADMRFFGVATDFALDLPRLSEFLGSRAQLTPVWRRFDARAMFWSDYLVEVGYGQGRLFVTTLRLEGGLGYQPDSFVTNPMGAWILASLLNLILET